jgi:VWFA-related protein
MIIGICRRVCMAVVLCAPVLCGVRPSAAREIPAPDPAAAEGLFKLDVVVTDTSGKTVTGLHANDFTLLDNGQPSKILSFQAFDGVNAKPDPPVEVILVIDTLSLPFHLAQHEREEAERFLRQNSGHLAHPVTIFGLSDNGLWTLSHPSGDGNALAADLAHHRESSVISQATKGGFDLRGHSLAALSFEDPPALSALKALRYIATTERRKPGRKLLIWVGPGWGVGSGKPFESLLDREHLFNAIHWYSALLREARVALYTFSVAEKVSKAGTIESPMLYRQFLGGVKSAKEADVGYLDRRVLAVESGGRVLDPHRDLATSAAYNANSMEWGESPGRGTEAAAQLADFDLVSQIDSCVAEASTFYTLSFNPAGTKIPDEYRSLEVKTGSPGLTARTNTGYYDEPYFYDEPPPAARRVTVEQLEEEMRAAHGKSDAEVARQLSGLELSERLSEMKLASLKAGLHGAKAAAALTALADASAFLAPPPAEVPAGAPPDAAARSRMIALAVDYLKMTLPKLPNFIAARTTVRFEETPEHFDQTGLNRIAYRPLHLTDSSKVTVLYRNGDEAVDFGTAKHKQPKPQELGLVTKGTFGPILSTVILDAVAARSHLTWSRWEQGPDRPRAVFRYTIPEKASHFEVKYCCLPDGDGTSEFQKLSAYHGEIAIDPVSGSILRLVAESDLKPSLPLARSDILVDYGPVEIGEKTYICPVKSVSITRGRIVLQLTDGDDSFRTFGPYATWLNDEAFADYHMFRAESRVLPGYDPEPQGQPGGAGDTGTQTDKPKP